MTLTPFAPRIFLAETGDFTNLLELETIFHRLQELLEKSGDVADLENWLAAYGEVQSAIDQERSLRYIAMTCHTDCPDREKAYLQFVEEIDPWLKPRGFALEQKFVAHPAFPHLPEYYKIFQRSVQTQVTLFREKNVEREKQVARLSQQYQKVIGAMTVHFDDQEQTLPQLSRVLEEVDRARRQRAWEGITARRLQDKDQLEGLFDDLLKLRVEIAQEAGFADYRAFKFTQNERFDYTPEDCEEFHRSIEKYLVPLARRLQEGRRQKLGVDALRPWDLSVDPEQRAPLRPFSGAQELTEKTGRIFRKLDPRLSEYYDLMLRHELVDLENRKGKAPGGYQCTLAESRLPFIFMNSVGMQRDVETLLHEAGHAFHMLAAREEKLFAYRGAPIEFCEVASMSMELLAAPGLTEFYAPAELARARCDHLEGIIKFFPWMAIVDAFQHWIYTHPDHTREQRSEYWISLMDRFGGIEDWSGYHEARGYGWHRQLHIFELPFYYVEYGIAQLGALQIWRKSLLNPREALDGYLAGLSCGGRLPLPELFSAAGIRFDFSAETIRPLVEAVEAEMAALAAAG